MNTILSKLIQFIQDQINQPNEKRFAPKANRFILKRKRFRAKEAKLRLFLKFIFLFHFYLLILVNCTFLN
jgi:hypothetical protein